MRRINSIVESEFTPSKNDIWLYKGTLKYFGPNGWTNLKADIESIKVPEATTTTIGGVKKAANITNLATASELPAVITKVNAILSALKTAGIMVNS